ncbi:MAG: glycosyltransferase [Bacteroides sp.]|nr:glycosyltransferase [Bacteroides sp.]
MKISVITSTFNSAKTVRDTFESILRQTHTDIECIVVDGASRDGTVDIIREYESKFNGRMRWISEPDKGIYDAMNKGIKMASGEIIGFLNSDDVFANQNILRRIDTEIQNVDCIYGNLDFVEISSTSKIVRTWRGSPYTKGAFKRGWHPAHPTFYARKECYEKFGGYNTSLSVSADFELMLRFLEKNNISNKFIPEVLVHMRMGGESTGSLKNILIGNKNILKAFEINEITPQRFYTFRRLIPKLINRIKHH